ncbi:cytochrome o ubiquinol oxidase subunit III [Chelativorans salis]|uniref:Cytochrome bo(3) ubiquinol oxidase subunit 3 n=1 Tax=Chelativorans salis TaxID=2978478 RepID=A0ABT2LU15_9HYPH|nr:cytochrome o ubiquinol oxidase subunit III [Chelativorans sp. EGI FJ00035]MCT7377866.1 cytochrome o ubiquinol oxidase subunit III [Chelativorans sp. EGI FJ00035]
MQQSILITPSAGLDLQEDHDTRSTTLLGFWIYLMSDCILFAALFATYVVLSNAVAGGQTGRELFDLPYALVETFLLLVSSFTCGLATLAIPRGSKGGVVAWLAVTFLLGFAFIGMELYEFHGLIADGAGPDSSAFLTGFFTLVGTHGLHVTAGLVWVTVLMVLVVRNGLTETNETRLMCFSLFWHFLDIVWVGVFTTVYLWGVM